MSSTPLPLWRGQDRKSVRRLAHQPQAARGHRADRQGRAFAAFLSRIIAKQLDQSLDRLKTDYVDIYFMHRDNPDIPVGEFVDAMDAEVKQRPGARSIGGSNWTRERMDEANAYAEKNGKRRRRRSPTISRWPR